MAQFIDRRLNGKNKSAVNRQRFLRRHKEQIKESVADAVNRRSITNTETGEDVTIPHKDIKPHPWRTLKTRSSHKETHTFDQRGSSGF